MVFFEHHGLEEQESFRAFSPSSKNFPLHFHRAFEMIFVEEGSLLLTIEQSDYHLHKGHAAFVFPNQMHGFKSLDSSHLTILIFSPELIGHFATRYHGKVPVNPVFHWNRSVHQDQFQSIYSQKSFLYGMCDTLMQATPFSAVSYSPKTKIVQKILAYVDDHYTQPITLKEVAVHLQYDYAYLSKLFQQMTQLAFTEYVNQYRISQACYQLKSTKKSISEIALDSGYQNLRTFNRNFQTVMHMTPMEYRLEKLL